MKIVLDLTELVAEAKLTAAQAEELKALAKPQTSLLAINLLMAFGVFAIAAGVLALLPTAPTAIVLGIVLLGIGVAISFGVGPQWSLLGTAVTIAGALIAGAGIVGQFDGGWIGFALAAILLLALAVAIRSALLSALSVFAIAELLGSRTAYGSATYFLAVSEPTVTIIAFSLFSLAAYLIGRQAPARYERVAFAFSRISLVMVNFGFWIGSLWGDDPGHSWRGADAGVGIHIPDYVFGIGWLSPWSRSDAGRRGSIAGLSSTPPRRLARSTSTRNGSSGSALSRWRSCWRVCWSLPLPWVCGATTQDRTSPTSPRSRRSVQGRQARPSNWPYLRKCSPAS